MSPQGSKVLSSKNKKYHKKSDHHRSFITPQEPVEDLALNLKIIEDQSRRTKRINATYIVQTVEETSTLESDVLSSLASEIGGNNIKLAGNEKGLDRSTEDTMIEKEGRDPMLT